MKKITDKIKYVTSKEFAELGTKEFVLGRIVDGVFDAASGLLIMGVGIAGSYIMFLIQIKMGAF